MESSSQPNSIQTKQTKGVTNKIDVLIKLANWIKPNFRIQFT